MAGDMARPSIMGVADVANALLDSLTRSAVMGEVSPAPETAARVIEDLTSLEVDTAKGERLYKAALVRSKTGTTYRMLAKRMQDGRLDLVHYGCTLDDEGKPTTKWAIRRIMEQ